MFESLAVRVLLIEQHNVRLAVAGLGGDHAQLALLAAHAMAPRLRALSNSSAERSCRQQPRRLMNSRNSRADPDEDFRRRFQRDRIVDFRATETETAPESREAKELRELFGRVLRT